MGRTMENSVTIKDDSSISTRMQEVTKFVNGIDMVSSSCVELQYFLMLTDGNRP